jgi:hypothetical protein
LLLKQPSAILVAFIVLLATLSAASEQAATIDNIDKKLLDGSKLLLTAINR